MCSTGDKSSTWYLKSWSNVRSIHPRLTNTYRTQSLKRRVCLLACQRLSLLFELPENIHPSSLAFDFGLCSSCTFRDDLAITMYDDNKVLATICNYALPLWLPWMCTEAIGHSAILMHNADCASCHTWPSSQFAKPIIGKSSFWNNKNEFAVTS